MAKKNKNLKNGQEIVSSVSNSLSTKEEGVSGLQYSFGKPRQDPLKLLRGAKKNRYYEEMIYNSPVIGGWLNLIYGLISQTKFWHEINGKEEIDLFYKNYMDQVLFQDMEHSWQDFVHNYISTFPFGFSVHEMVYKKRLGQKNKDVRKKSKFNDGYFGIRKIAHRYQTTIEKWIFDEKGNVTGIIQRDPNSLRLIEIPIEKLLHFKIKSPDGNPEGLSLIRNCFTSYFYSKNLQNIESIKLEKDCRGTVIYKIPRQYCVANSTNPDVIAMNKVAKDTAENISNGEVTGIVMPFAPDFEISMLQGKPVDVTGYNIVIERHNRDMLIALLSDFLLLGHDGKSGAETTKAKIKIFSAFISMLLDILTDKFNNEVIPKLFEINGFETENYPILKHTNLEELNEMVAALFIQSAHKIGLLTKSLDTENYMREKFIGSDCPKITQEEYEEAEEKLLEEQNSGSDNNSNNTNIGNEEDDSE
jgi:hypothetical protein